MKLLWLSFWLYAAPFVLTAASYPAELVRIIDGDTVVLEWNKQQDTVRIIGINTPEVTGPHTTGECFGQQASQYAHSLISNNQPLTLEFTGDYDQYDRALGYLTLSDGRDFGHVMIHDGYAYAYRTYNHSRQSAYTTAEQLAHSDAQGLWHKSACAHSIDTQAQMKLLWQERFDFIQSFVRLIFSQLF